MGVDEKSCSTSSSEHVIMFMHLQFASLLSATQPRFFFQHLLLELSQSSSPAHVVTKRLPKHRSVASKGNQ